MFLWALWRWLFGWVQWEAQGGLCERFLNLLAKEPVELWNIRRNGDMLTARCPARHYRLLRPFARRTGTRLHIRRKSGLPFVLHGMRGRQGLAVGAVLALVLYMALSSRIWVIDVSVEDPATAALITQQVAPYGVAIGQKMQEVDIASLRLQSIANISEINWLSVHFEGSVAHVEASLQKDSANRETDTPSNLVASCDGRIIRMEVTGGQAMKKVGEGVVKGDLLVCGAVDTTAGTLLRRSTGEVIAETTHTLQVSVRQSELCLLPSGQVWKQPTLWLFGLSLPLYTNVAFPESCEQRLEMHFATLRGTTLPVGITERQFMEMTPQQVERTAEETEALAADQLAARVEETLAAADITAQDTVGSWSDGVYTLTGTYQCVENIATEQPMLITG